MLIRGKKIRLLFLAMALPVVGVLGFWGWRIHTLNQDHQRRLHEAKSAYQTQINDLMAQPASPDSAADIHAFVAFETLRDLAKPLVGHPLKLGTAAVFNVNSVGLRAVEGMPLIELEGALTLAAAPGSNIGIRGAATISPPVIKEGKFSSRLRLVSIEPLYDISSAWLVLPQAFGEMAKVISQQQLDKMPDIALPIQKDFTIPVQGSTKPIEFKTRPPYADHIKGNLTIPGFELSASLSLQRAIFLDDGLHLFLTLDSGVAAPLGADTWATESAAERIASLKEPSASYFFRVNLRAFNSLLAKVAAFPTESRTVKFKSTERHGNFIHETGSTRFGASEKRVFLHHPDSLSASAALDSLVFAPKDQCLAQVQMETTVKGRIQFGGHYDPGLGGGSGFNVGGLINDQRYTLKGDIRLAETQVGGIPQIVGVLTGPPSIGVSLQVLLRGLGSHTFSQQVPLPEGAILFTTPLLTGLHTQVSVKLADDVVVTQQVSVSDFVVKQGPQGLHLSSKLNITTAP